MMALIPEQIYHIIIYLGHGVFQVSRALLSHN